MVFRTTIALLLLALLAMAQPALADDDGPLPDPAPEQLTVPGGSCPVVYVLDDYPYVEPHPECI